MLEKYKHLISGFANGIILLYEACLFACCWFGYYANWIGKEGIRAAFHMWGNWAVIGIYTLICFFFTNIIGGYKINYSQKVDIIFSQILAAVFANIVGYLELCLVCRDYVKVHMLALCFLAECIGIVCWSLGIHAIYKILFPPRQLLLIYGNYSPEELIVKINSRTDRYRICETVCYRLGKEQIEKKIEGYKAVVLADLPDEERNTLIKHCYRNSIRVYVVPKITDIILRGAENIHLFDTPILLCRNQGLTLWQRFLKRICDIVISIAAIVVFSPAMLIIAVCVHFYDGGPVLFKQERLTRDGKTFQIYKFRSMCVRSEDQEQITKKNDSRVTPVGKVIRTIHFDELPQLFNILKGEMSVVGPRPEWVLTTSKYDTEVPEFRFRLKVKAGLTGYAQVWGQYSTTPLDKMKLDLMYIENYSLWLDLKIIILTVKIFFNKTKSEGVNPEQNSALKDDVE